MVTVAIRKLNNTRMKPFKISHGGKREGAGRKQGIANTKTREIADRAIAQGITPLEVMLSVMRESWAQAESVVLTPGDDNALAVRHLLQNRALSAANDAAPFLHPKLAPVDAKTGEVAKFVIIDPTN